MHSKCSSGHFSDKKTIKSPSSSSEVLWQCLVGQNKAQKMVDDKQITIQYPVGGDLTGIPWAADSPRLSSHWDSSQEDNQVSYRRGQAEDFQNIDPLLLVFVMVVISAWWWWLASLCCYIQLVLLYWRQPRLLTGPTAGGWTAVTTLTGTAHLAAISSSNISIPHSGPISRITILTQTAALRFHLIAENTGISTDFSCCCSSLDNNERLCDLNAGFSVEVTGCHDRSV